MSLAHPSSRSPVPGPLVVTGLPGSDLLPVGLALHRGGVDLGTEFGDYYAPALCDLEISRLHDQLLSATRAEFFTDGDPARLATTLGAEGAREAAVAGRSRELPWGWVEMRSALLLPVWEEAFPKARWIFVLAPPAAAARAAVGDRTLSRLVGLPYRRALRGLRLWARAGTLAADFARRLPDRCLFLDASRDLTADGASRFASTLANWGYDLDVDDIAEVFKRYGPSRPSRRWLRRLALLHPPTRRGVAGLKELGRQTTSRIGVDQRPGTAEPALSVAIVGTRPEYSQTFVHGLEHGLPCQVASVALTEDRFGVDGVDVRTNAERALGVLLKEFGVTGTRIRDRSFARFLRRRGIHAVLAQFGPHAVASLPGCRLAGVPLIAHFRGFDAHRDPVLERYGEEYAEVYAHAAAIVTSSKSIADRLVASGAPAEKIVSTSSGADSWSFRTADAAANPPTFVAVGRFVEKKGPFLTILAFHEVAKAVPEARLVMIGDGVLRGPSIQLARALGLEQRVSFPGARRPWEVADHMASARAFVQHSLVAEDGDAEGTPVAVLEASATGLPVVATAHAGIVEAVIDDVTGFLVPEGDVAAMAARMLRLATEPELAERLGRAGQEHILACHSREGMLARVWEVVQEVTGRPAMEATRPRPLAAPETAAESQ